MDLWVECQCPGVNVPISTNNKAAGRVGEASGQQSRPGRWSLLSSPSMSSSPGTREAKGKGKADSL